MFLSCIFLPLLFNTLLLNFCLMLSIEINEHRIGKEPAFLVDIFDFQCSISRFLFPLFLLSIYLLSEFVTVNILKNERSLLPTNFPFQLGFSNLSIMQRCLE